jgi:galactonate dehydratase
VVRIVKITDIQTFIVGSSSVLLRVLTDEHLQGTGEAYRIGPDEAVVKTIHDFKDWLIGQDPMRIEYLWRLMYNGSRFPTGSVITAAISGIDMALWDLKGKVLKGQQRSSLRIWLARDVP